LVAFAAVVYGPQGRVEAATVVPGPVNDQRGDFSPIYGGNKNADADLDVRFAQVFYNPSAQTITFLAQMWGTIGTTPGGFYVWGINRGPGTEQFNLPTVPVENRTGAGVFFDTVLVLRPGQLTLGAPIVLSSRSTTLNDTLSLTIPIVSGTTLFPNPFPSTFLPIEQWTYNLWPRTGAPGVTGNAQISDFAPDNANILTTIGVPEPMSVVAMGTGMGLVLAMGAWKRRSRRTS